jgi:hypothetical protein
MKLKSLFLLGILLHVLSTKAQTNAITYQDTIKCTTLRWQDTCFSLLNLSSSQIPSGYLLDYSLATFNDSSYNSLSSSNIDTLKDYGDFFALHKIFTLSNVNTNAVPLGSTDSLFINAYRYQRDSGYIPLLFLYQQYQKIDKNALQEDLFTLTSDSVRLMDVANRKTSPYDNKYFFAFTPYQTNITQFNTIKFAFPSQFWLMPGITSVQVNFGDGSGLRTITPGSKISINYNSSGTYYLTAQIVTTYGTLIAKSEVQYTQPTKYVNPDSTWNITVPPLYTSISNYINANQSAIKTQGIVLPQGAPVTSCSDGTLFNQINCDINPGATVTIINGCDHVFDKPIIVVEGFDPTNSVTYLDLQAELNFMYRW